MNHTRIMDKIAGSLVILMAVIQVFATTDPWVGLPTTLLGIYYIVK